MYVSIRYHHFWKNQGTHQQRSHTATLAATTLGKSAIRRRGGRPTNLRSSLPLISRQIMPSRKKVKGKARKAAKEAKAKKEEENQDRAVVEVADNQRQEESLEAQLKLLIINDPKQLCWHVRPLLSPEEGKACEEFISAYLEALFPLIDQGNSMGRAFFEATKATVQKYADVFSSKLGTVISFLLSTGTDMLRNGQKECAQIYASIACYFGDSMAVNVLKTKANFGWAKIGELYYADDHTLVSYYRKHTSCSCLDEIYKEVKSLKKMGHCYNPNCSHPRGRVERSKMFSCTRCCIANYCSVECQKSHWKLHRKACDYDAKQKAAFDLEQAFAGKGVDLILPWRAS